MTGYIWQYVLDTVNYGETYYLTTEEDLKDFLAHELDDFQQRSYRYDECEGDDDSSHDFHGGWFG